MNYRSVSDLNEAIKCWICQLPEDLNIIVGIPRSGLLVANLLALYLNLPLTDVEGLCQRRILSTGPRLDEKRIPNFSNKDLKVLVVDDSVYSGTQMEKVKEKIESAKLPYRIYYGAVYITPHGHKYVDYWYEIVDLPRCFEWNIMHHGILTSSCVDIDGVLCRDPTEEENDDGERYREFLANVKPLLVPTKPIGWLVTCRLEKYRELTESWLRKHGIQYKCLLMMGLPDKATRLALGNHAKFKAEIYKSVNASLFIESSYQQALEIAQRTGKPVFCFETGQMIKPGFAMKNYNRLKRLAKEISLHPFNFPIKVLRFLKRNLGILYYKMLAKRKKMVKLRKDRDSKIWHSRER